MTSQWSQKATLEISSPYYKRFAGEGSRFKEHEDLPLLISLPADSDDRLALCKCNYYGRLWQVVVVICSDNFCPLGATLVTSTAAWDGWGIAHLGALAGQSLLKR